MDIAIKLGMVVILIALTAFFVASEFAIVKVRSSRINQLVEEGHRSALAAKKVTTHLDEYLSACQLGITVTALGLGWLGEPTVEQLFRPLFERMELNDSAAHLLSFFIAFIFMTYIHVVVGELAPKTAAIQKAEQITLLFAKPLILFYRILFPFIWVLNGSARVLTGLFGLKPASEKEVAHSEEELRMILSDSYESGEINQSEFKYVNKIFEFDERIAKEIMVPRTAMITIEKDIPLPEIIDIIQKEKFTRYPVTDGDKDNVIGMVNIKTLYTATITEKNAATLKVEDFMTPIIRVLEKSPIHDLLLKMQKEGTHMAILSDEYGGTAGLVTVEDILEEIVGEIRDEFDQDERPLIQKLKENHYIFDAKTLIHEVSDTLGIEMPEQDIDTLGGWILTEKSDVQMDDVLEFGGYLFKVKELDGHHILYVEVESMGSEI
ncbi:hemolysin family protein [Bacillus sp. V59.32b]|uniref:hemolysin family protein n=1 Tax=Bacillus sp. V59.32b TaxID=1758642 RepID=UPI000E3DD30F|nr:hemolysin family protein [Bacillus sp. V59.32b]RFU60102.1 HlyC/CorC family transporter [Bacillus sp. V59.32b]